jgi:hypothetical protein
LTLGLFVVHDAACRFGRYSRWRSWRVDSPETTTVAAADSRAPTLPPNGRAELDMTRSAMIASIIRITGTADFDLVVIPNSEITQIN